MKYGKDFKHPLRTRRDFLAQGLIGFSAMIAMPNFFGVGIRKVLNETCSGGTGPTMVPFLAFDMAGGAALPANFLVGKQGGPKDFLSSYDKLGWNPIKDKLYEDFGLPMSLDYSKILAGIMANTSQEARRNLRMGSFCHFAQDDSTGNKLNAGTLALMSGYRGQFISNGVGIQSSPSGGNSMSTVDSVALKPTFVSSVEAVLGSANFGGTSFKDLSIEQLKAMAENGIELSRIQKNDYIDLPDGKILADLSKCAYEKSLDFLEGVEGLDPRLDAAAQAVYQIDPNTSGSSFSAVAAALAMNTIKGQSGPSVWTVGGCDYHDGTQTTGDTKDLEMGVEIGRAVELAHRLKRPLFFELLTDGGCDATEGTRMWRGDSGDKCMTVIGYYNPDAPPKMIRTQVGYYTDGQAAERMTLIGSDPGLVGYAVFANYLNINGKLAEFHNYAPDIFKEAKQLESILIFEGKA